MDDNDMSTPPKDYAEKDYRSDADPMDRSAPAWLALGAAIALIALAAALY